MAFRGLAVLPLALLSSLLAGPSGRVTEASAAWAAVAEAAPAPGAAAAEWVVDPKDPGPSLPPVGRSLFDFAVTGPGGPGTVPFPFAALTRLIENRLAGAEDPTPAKRVLIPLNRSLQRNAARPDFFFYPRVVMAVDGEGAPRGGRAAMLLRDRLFVGYQEKAGILEVISYNEGAGRFEFQVVKDYRAGGAPQIFYANRAVCVVCHQNHAPIFSRQLWDETSSNPGIAAMLRAQGREFYGVSLEQGVDIPYAVDNATDRANGLAAYQRLWQDGCAGGTPAEAVDCRASLFTLALRYRLGGARQVDARSTVFRDRLVPRLARRWQDRWPRGLAVPSPDIPNRDPLAPLEDRIAALPVSGPAREERLAELVKRSDVHARFEPSTPRAPLEIWSISPQATEPLERAIAGLGSFLAAADLHRLDRRLAALAEGPGIRQRSRVSECEIELIRRDGERRRLAFRCVAAAGAAGPATLDGVAYAESDRIARGSIERAVVGDGDELRDLEVVGGRIQIGTGGLTADLRVAQRGSRLNARGADGSLVRRIGLRGVPRPSAADGDRSVFPGEATILLADDFAAVGAAVARMAGRTASGAFDVFAAKPFRRASLMGALERELGITPSLEWCCADGGSLPPARLDGDSLAAGPARPGAPEAGAADARAMALFQRYCSLCHRTRDSFPPNFLTGPPALVRANLAQCAERIFVRLNMWRLDPEARVKTPMPPIYALHGLNVPSEEWPGHPDLQALRGYVGDVLKSQTGRDPRLEELMARNYEHLRGCLPAQAKR